MTLNNFQKSTFTACLIQGTTNHRQTKTKTKHHRTKEQVIKVSIVIGDKSIEIFNSEQHS